MEIRKATLSDLADLSKLFDAYRQFYRQPSDETGALNFIRDRMTQKDQFLITEI